MGILSWLRGRSPMVDYGTASDERLRELWDGRADLTDEARARLDRELGKRGLDFDRPPPKAAPEPPPEPRKTRLPDGLADRFPAKGPIQSARTTRDVRVHGVPCKGDTQLVFARNGRLINAQLAIDWTCDGVQLPAGALVGFSDGGRLNTWLATLPAPRVVCGVELPAGTQVSVFDDQLETLELVAPLTIAGHVFPSGTSLAFADAGHLSSATCLEEVTIAGIPCGAYETIRFDANGALAEAYLARDHEIQGVPCQGHEIVRFFESGQLGRCYVTRDFELDGVPCAEGTRIYLDSAGHLLEATAAHDLVLDGVPCPAGTRGSAAFRARARRPRRRSSTTSPSTAST